MVTGVEAGSSVGLMQVKPHTYHKYSILRKYLLACKRFSDKYENFVYVETHGGTGEVIDYGTGRRVDGSVLIAAKVQPSFPCHVVEIDPQRYEALRRAVQPYPHVRTYHGDCNALIDTILRQIPRGRVFVFCFMDPDGLVYKDVDQLRWTTVEKVACFPRTEVLINVPMQAIMRAAGAAKNDGRDWGSLTRFFGTTRWSKYEPGDYRGLVRLYVSERLEGRYKYIGAILVRAEKTRAPVYYLVYGTNSEVGAKIMRDIFKKEWLLMRRGQYPVSRGWYASDSEWLDAEYPYERFFFED
jgi:three-Cys-motif partner protein